jgi:AcrR family transcriptional regulator
MRIHMATHTPEPTTVPRRQRADAQRNSDRVLAAARVVFAEEGPDATLEEIARRAGVGIGTLYRHYPSRNDLLLAVFRDDIDAARSSAAALLESDDPGDAFATWLRGQLAAAGSCRALGASVMIQMLDDAPDKQSSCEALREAGAELLRRAQAAGAVRADANIDELLRMVSAIAIATEDAPDAGAQADRLFTLVFDGIRA